MWTFAPNVLHHLSTYFVETVLFKIVRNVQARKSILKWGYALNIHDPNNLLAVDCRAAQIFLKKSQIQHKDIGIGGFAGRPSSAQVLVAFYYSWHNYSNHL